MGHLQTNLDILLSIFIPSLCLKDVIRKGLIQISPVTDKVNKKLTKSDKNDKEIMD